MLEVVGETSCHLDHAHVHLPACDRCQRSTNPIVSHVEESNVDERGHGHDAEVNGTVAPDQVHEVRTGEGRAALAELAHTVCAAYHEAKYEDIPYSLCHPCEGHIYGEKLKEISL